MNSKEQEYEDVLDRAYTKIRDLKEQLAARHEEDLIAIVGYGCRFPGGIVDGTSFWKALNSGFDTFSRVDDRRWPITQHYDPDGKATGRMYTLSAGLTANVDHFDASFFGVPAIEAELLDPQQRMLLEVSWHAFENAGIDPLELRGSQTGVFVGQTADDYLRLHTRSGLPVSAYSGLGSAKSMAAGRLAYFYDFQGPALQLDTTCSSSLVALHLAARELRDRNCDLALVGGSNAIVSPDSTIGFCEMHALSRSGKLRAFDESADGYVRGEGCGVLIVKRYADAVRDRDRIHAVVLGSAINHDGRTNGLTAPNPLAQERVIRKALRAARRNAHEVQYVEAHGTGTPLGDLMEANALGAVHKHREDRLRIGSVKANIGHLEAAAGVASIIKVILGLAHGKIPGQVNFSAPSRRLDWNALKLDVSGADWDWPCPDHGRCAGVSSFGMSGTNAHIVLGEAPRTDTPNVRSATGSSLLSNALLLSARTPHALKRRMGQWASRIAVGNECDIAALLSASRDRLTHFDEFRCAVHGSRDELVAQLEARASDEPERAIESSRNGVVFVFGDEQFCYPGMASGLYRQEPAFAMALDACARIFADESGGDLIDLCTNPHLSSSELEPPQVRIPVITAMQIALVALWRAQGITAMAVVGHCAGEYAAAVSAGHVTPVAAMRLACLRGHAAASAASGDDMASRGDQEALASAVACIEVASTDTIWIDESSVAAVDERAIRARLMVPSAAPAALDAKIERLLALGFRHFLEISAEAALVQTIRARAGDNRVVVVGSLRRHGSASEDLRASLIGLYEAGVRIVRDPATRSPAVSTELPRYPFEPRRFWMKSRELPACQTNAREAVGAMGFSPVRIGGDESCSTFRVTLDVDKQPHLAHHKLFGVTVVAGASWISLILSLGQAVLSGKAIAISQLKFLRPLILSIEKSCEVCFDLRPGPDRGFKFVTYSRPREGASVVHCEGLIQDLVAEPQVIHADRWRNESAPKEADLSGFYEDFTTRGYTLGPAFHWLRKGADGEQSALRQLKRPVLPADENAYVLYPGLIDSCFHGLAGLLGGDVDLKHADGLSFGEEIVIPAEVDEIRFHGNLGALAEYTMYASRAGLDGGASTLLNGGFSLHDVADSAPQFEVYGLQFKRIAKSTLERLVSSGRDTQMNTMVPTWIPVAGQKASASEAVLVASIGADGDRDACAEAHMDLGDVLDGSQAAAALKDAHARLARDGAAKQRIIVVHPEVGAPGAADELEERIVASCQRWARLLHALGQASGEDILRLQVVLPGALQFCANHSSLINSAVCGFLTSAAAEYPHLVVQIVDGELTEESVSAGMIGLLREDALTECGAGEFLWKHGQWHARALQDGVGDAVDAPVYLEGGLAIVTGGTGGLAPSLVSWLLDRGASRVWLMGRSCVDGDAFPAFEGRVIYRRCDVANQASVAALFADAARLGHRVTAVVHAAGVVVDGMVGQLTDADLHAVLKPKTSGAMHLEHAWNADDLRLVVATSSLVSVMASAGQSAYTAANRFLDRWTEWLRGEGLRAVTVNLGPVDAGMAARLDDTHKQRIRRQGLDLMPASCVFDAMESALTVRGGHLAVYASVAEMPASRGARKAPSDMVGAPKAERTVTALSVELATMLGHSEPLPAHMSLKNIGMDSLLAVELASWINDTFVVDLEIEQIVNQSTVGDLANVIDRALANVDSDRRTVEANT